ncbi:unnamed protein product [Paramecium pentaurelia]|uniref:Uncharacterized protein n=1 Tax=Paramecium pentaurelia TaxID=43138 RepID=A0A8S1V1L8_9CILI|nr:unnamed protein product [Paramecium pentaurelia]
MDREHLQNFSIIIAKSFWIKKKEKDIIINAKICSNKMKSDQNIYFANKKLNSNVLTDQQPKLFILRNQQCNDVKRSFTIFKSQQSIIISQEIEFGFLKYSLKRYKNHQKSIIINLLQIQYIPKIQDFKIKKVLTQKQNEIVQT